MEPERDEVYERIPWETLESKGGDRQWLVYAVAGALVLGALAYSFTRSQPPAPTPQVAETAAVSTVTATTAISNMGSTAPTVTSPVVVAEADLFAVDPERLVDHAAAHAEWFGVEYISYDGTPESATILEDLLPRGTPLPQASEGTQVFVDWAGATAITQTGPVTFDVEVVVRSLLAQDGSAFVRQPPLRLVVPIEIDGDGAARVSRPPFVAEAEVVGSVDMSLQTVPEEVSAAVDVEGEVVGGFQGPAGAWLVVVMSEGADGVTRPVMVSP